MEEKTANTIILIALAVGISANWIIWAYRKKCLNDSFVSGTIFYTIYAVLVYLVWLWFVNNCKGLQ